MKRLFRNVRPVLLIAICMVASFASRAEAQAGRAPARVRESTGPLVIGETFTIQSRALGELRRINVYKPPLYDDTARALPVMYMPDGGTREDFVHVAGLIEVLVGDGLMRPFLLVGIENTERRRDLTGPTTVAKDSTIAKHVSGSAAFRRFIRTELMPRVKARYRTTNETAIVGESLAGLFITETFFVEPDLFDTYIAIDPSLWWNNSRLVADAPAALKAMGPSHKTLYLTNSDEPVIAGDTKKMAAILTANAPQSLTWLYEPLPNETHATIYHPAAFNAFKKLFKPAPLTK